jgi:hypothetical protein
MAEESKHPMRIAIISASVSFFLSAVFAAYIVGQRTGKILDIEKWRNETAPRIERIDAQGTLSQQFFLKNYAEEQAKQYKRLDVLEEKVSHLETMEWRIDRLEKNHADKPNQ